MKKIMVLSIGLMFASVQAQMHSDIEVAQVIAALMQDTELMAHCHTLHEHSLTLEQVVEQLMQCDAKQACEEYTSYSQMRGPLCLDERNQGIGEPDMTVKAFCYFMMLLDGIICVYGAGLIAAVFLCITNPSLIIEGV